MKTLDAIRRTVLCLAMVGVLAPSAHARWARLWEPVPVNRLIRNLESRVKQAPRDAEAHYALGRVHSFAYARRETEQQVVVRDPQTGAERSAPTFPVYETLAYVPQAERRLTPETRAHLRASIAHFRRAAKLDPGNALYALGLAWVCEQALQHPLDAGPPPGSKARGEKAVAAAWRREAVQAYRRAYALSRDDARGERHGLLGDATAPGSVVTEAGEGIQRMLTPGRPSAADRALLVDVEETARILKAKPRAVTPILVALRGERSLAELLAPGATVGFDLAGDGVARRWPWVRPETGILVWDPERSGRVASGRQLFGSATWWMLWPHGYAPLDALDDNRNGELAGHELAGLAVWRDQNANGVSDPGEVVPVAALGVVAIATRATGSRDGVPWNPRGVRFGNGASGASYDWVPQAMAERVER